MHSIALGHDFALAMGTSVLDHTIGRARAHMLQNWPNLVKYDFVDLLVSFPMTKNAPIRVLQL